LFERVRRPAAPRASVAPVDVIQDVVAFLAGQGLPGTPANYELGYAYRTKASTLLARAVDAVTMSGDQLTQAQADEIFQTHLRPAAGVDNDDRARMQQQTLNLSDIAADASAATSQFGRDLSVGLKACNAAEFDLPVVVGAMLDRTRTAEQAFAKAGHAIEDLRQDVGAASGDNERDVLTGLYNRRGVQAELRGNAKARAQSVVAICDIDHFRTINQRHGQAIGDRVLKFVAASLSESCSPHLVARWGGEEFIMLLNGVGVAEAATLVNRARVDLSARELRIRETEQTIGSITFSAGVAPLGGRKFDDAAEEAMRLLREAKAGGRNRVER
jgi:diguanylate cyclase